MRNGHAALLGIAACWLVGCAPPDTGSYKTLDSKLFSHVTVIGERGGGAGQFNKPRSVGVDGDDNIYVVDLTGRVQKFSPDGGYLLGWQMPETDKGKAKGMCTGLDGNIILIEPHYTRVNHFDREGGLVHQWGENGREVGQLIFPRGIAVAPDGAIWISEYSFAERLQKFAPGGTNVLFSIGEPGAGPRQFNRAEGLGINEEGQVFVADSCNHRIQIFSADGEFLREYGRAGSLPGEMSYPYDIRIDADGRQIVCEFGNSRIQVFDSEDEVVEIIGEAGSEPGRFSNPWSIALDSKGNLIVADSMNHRVQKLWRRKPAGVVLKEPGWSPQPPLLLLPPVKERNEGGNLGVPQPQIELSRLTRSGDRPRPRGEGESIKRIELQHPSAFPRAVPNSSSLSLGRGIEGERKGALRRPVALRNRSTALRGTLGDRSVAVPREAERS